MQNKSASITINARLHTRRMRFSLSITLNILDLLLYALDPKTPLMKDCSPLLTPKNRRSIPRNVIFYKFVYGMHFPSQVYNCQNIFTNGHILPCFDAFLRQKNPAIGGISGQSDYSSAGAPTGQTPAQAPQEMQVSASITYLPSPSLIAETGHSSAQAPQATHSSLITYAMINYLHILLCSYYISFPGKKQDLTGPKAPSNRI